MDSTHSHRAVPRFSNTLTSAIENLVNTSRTCKQLLSIGIDSTLVLLSLWLGYSIRLGEVFSDFQSSWHLFLFMPATTVSVFLAFGIYRWVIRSSNMRLFRQLAKACLISAVLLVLLSYLLPVDGKNPRSLFVIYGLLLLTGTCGVRLTWQKFFHCGTRGEPVVIYGAGSAGIQLMRLLALGKLYRTVAFIDDNPNLQSSMVAGLPVLDGNSADLGVSLKRLEASQVILALPTASTSDYQKKLARLQRIGLPVKTVPSIAEVVSGKAKPHQIRDVAISDVLGRSEVAPDVELMGGCVKGKVVLVTGGGGSIGSELCREIAALQPRELVLVDNCEANLYHITEELGRRSQSADRFELCFTPVLCSVLERRRINRLIRDHQVDTIYHAAAYKHVPIVEAQPEQGVMVNVFGTLNVLNSALKHGVANFTLISTDKAVRPANAMGASKRVAEMILQAKAAQSPRTRISMVRFGNVLGSSGSVVPKFMSQIRNGGPVTITHPDMTRYFMTIPEAAQLVLQASSIATNGNVFVLDMGEPVRILDLARSMIELCGREVAGETSSPDAVEIEVTGLRPGEKLYEELFLSSNRSRTRIGKVFTAEEAWLHWERLQQGLEELRKLSEKVDRDALRTLLMDLAFSVDPNTAALPAANIVPIMRGGASLNRTGEISAPCVRRIHEIA